MKFLAAIVSRALPLLIGGYLILKWIVKHVLAYVLVPVTVPISWAGNPVMKWYSPRVAADYIWHMFIPRHIHVIIGLLIFGGIAFLFIHYGK